MGTFRRSVPILDPGFDTVEELMEPRPLCLAGSALLDGLQGVVETDECCRLVSRLEQAELAFEAFEQILERWMLLGPCRVQVEHETVVQPGTGRRAPQLPILSDGGGGCRFPRLGIQALLERMDES